MNARRLLLPALAAVLAGAPLLAQPDRSGPPKPGPVRPLKLPPVERLALSNGVGVLLVPMHEVPVVEVLLVMRAGATADPAGREGLARTTADMLDEGAGGRDALALADAIDFLGARLGTEASWDASIVRLRGRSWPMSPCGRTSRRESSSSPFPTCRPTRPHRP